MTKDEHTLINEIKSGSEESYRILYDKWVSRLYNFVYQYIKSESVTDDIVQETFLKIWTNKESLNPEYSFKSYLFTIAYHFLIKELRRQINNPLLFEYISYTNEFATSENETGNNIEFDQFRETLLQAKKLLSPRQRQIFEMNKEFNISIQEIAAKLSINEQVVRNQLSAALKIIRNELKPYSCLLILLFMKL